MTNEELVQRRLANQGISQPRFKTPREVVAWLGAVQAQDYAAAKWAVALRAQGVTDAAMDQALAEGTILRTHVLRPTWHLVIPEDIRWMLELTAPRIHALMTYQHRQLELDKTIFKRSHAALVKALQGGKQLTRSEITAALQRAGISTDGARLTYLLGQAEIDGVICSGGRRGKQFTYALLDERAAKAKTLPREQALFELARRYFTSRGPATLQDFVWWSGLAMTDARAALEMVKPQFEHELLEGQTFWFANSAQPIKHKSPAIYLLPNFDEYIVGYTDRRAVFDPSHLDKLDVRQNVLFTHTIVLDGQAVGTWKRTCTKDTVRIQTNPFRPFSKTEMRALAAALERFRKFGNWRLEVKGRDGKIQ